MDREAAWRLVQESVQAAGLRRGLGEQLEGLGVLAADTDPDRVRLVFSYEVGAEEAERAAKAVVAAAG